MSEEEIIVGIDLGTTNSCVGIWHNGSVKILANSDGLYVTPSYVSYSKDGILVGEPAKKQLLANPQNTVYDMKRVIGKPSIDEMIEKSKRYWTFKITQDKNLKPA
uniref:Heat shock protein 70 n=1 Tax=Acrobeloides nanus TaxID=290746 RepID=A0A914DG81_9BILA